MGKKSESPNHPSSPFKEKEKEGEGRPKAWWLMEGEGKGSLLGGQWKEKEKVLCLVVNGRRRKRFFAWWPMEGKREGSFVWWPMEGEGEGYFTWWSMEGEGEGSFLPIFTFPPSNFT